MPISDCEVRDPRVRRTRQLLQGALRDLMQKKSLEEISVQDITEAATVNRATFYDHYTDKFALLAAMVGGGFHKLLAERNVTFDGSCPSAAEAIILAACDYLVMAHSNSGGCNCNTFFEPLMEAAVVGAIRRVLLQGLSAKSARSGPSPELVATTASWAIYGAVKEWFYTPKHPPAAEAVGPILELVIPILEAGGSKSHPRPAAGASGKSVHFRDSRKDRAASN
ncbi:TetR/AcrR family transcriptional regulator [Edaphobacter acidisoli]|nr:TetR family transcriptional regulator [Edaphobacter acidisoli]